MSFDKLPSSRNWAAWLRMNDEHLNQAVRDNIGIPSFAAHIPDSLDVDVLEPDVDVQTGDNIRVKAVSKPAPVPKRIKPSVPVTKIKHAPKPADSKDHGVVAGIILSFGIVIGIVTMFTSFWAGLFVILAAAFFAALESAKDPKSDAVNPSRYVTSSPPHDPHLQTKMVYGRGGFFYRISGESFHRIAILKLVGNENEAVMDAYLVAEPTNKHDKYAIKVMISGAHVGYIPAADTYEWNRMLADASKRGITPVFKAKVWFGVLQSGGKAGSVKLDVPRDLDTAVPLNDPWESERLIPGGRYQKVKLLEGDTEALEDILTTPGFDRKAGFCFGVRSDGQKVEILYEGVPLGHLGPQVSKNLMSLVLKAEDKKVMLCAFGYAEGNSLDCKVSVDVCSASDLTEAQLAEILTTS